MSIFLYHVPSKFQAAYEAGQVLRYGAILKDAGTGYIVAHMQRTGALSGLINGIVPTVSNLATDVVPLGSMVSMIQNQQIIAGVQSIEAALPILKGLGMGTMMLSGAGLGVSVATLAVMQKRLTAIDNRLNELSAQVDRVTEDRRQDELGALMYKIRDTVDEAFDLHTRSDPSGAALRLEGSLNEYSSVLQARFQQVSSAATLTATDLEMLSALSAAIGACYEGSSRALYLIDELEAAAALSLRRARALMELSKGLSANHLRRRIASAEKGPEARRATLEKMEPRAALLLESLRGNIANIASQESLVLALRGKDISGPAYLEAVAEEDEPLLLLPA